MKNGNVAWIAWEKGVRGMGAAGRRGAPQRTRPFLKKKNRTSALLVVGVNEWRRGKVRKVDEVSIKGW